jgi:DNA-binding NarL/FixJ family response regulator
LQAFVYMAGPAAACRDLLREAGVPVPRQGAEVNAVPEQLRGLGVTGREMQVLLLVGEGMSNNDIATRLSLSPRTVETHVAHLLQRTGAGNRRQLITFLAS